MFVNFSVRSRWDLLKSCTKSVKSTLYLAGFAVTHLHWHLLNIHFIFSQYKNYDNYFNMIRKLMNGTLVNVVPSLYFLIARMWLVTGVFNLTLQMTVLLIFVSLLCLSACEVLNIECFLHIFFWWYAFMIRFLWPDKSLGVLILYTKWTGIWRVVVL